MTLTQQILQHLQPATGSLLMTLALVLMSHFGRQESLLEIGVTRVDVEYILLALTLSPSRALTYS